MLCNDGLQAFGLAAVAFAAGVLMRCLSCLTTCNVYFTEIIGMILSSKNHFKLPRIPITIIFDFFHFLLQSSAVIQKETNLVTCWLFSVSSPAAGFSGFLSDSGNCFLDFAYFLARNTFITSANSNKTSKGLN